MTRNTGWSVELKKQFYATLTGDLHEKIGIRTEDFFINLVEVAKQNWSFGGGIAQHTDSKSAFRRLPTVTHQNPHISCPRFKLASNRLSDSQASQR
ncbi:tautomerase family protein [Corynebacterium deserti]|uniref:tautomerase family protein n=1 Tax=Corynebacterium deserti TaxID=1408191 RepID=UPI0009EC7148